MNIYEKKGQELIKETMRIAAEIDEKYKDDKRITLDGRGTEELRQESRRFQKELRKLQKKYPDEFQEVIDKNSKED